MTPQVSQNLMLIAVAKPKKGNFSPPIKALGLV